MVLNLRGNCKDFEATLAGLSSEVEVLILSDNALGPGGAARLPAALAASSLLRLYLRNCSLGDTGAVRLVDGLRSSTRLEVVTRELHQLGTFRNLKSFLCWQRILRCCQFRVTAYWIEYRKTYFGFMFVSQLLRKEGVS